MTSKHSSMKGSHSSNSFIKHRNQLENVQHEAHEKEDAVSETAETPRRVLRSILTGWWLNVRV